MSHFKYQLLALALVDLAILSLFAIMHLKLIPFHISMAGIGFVLDIAVLALSGYLLKKNYQLLKTPGYSIYKYFIFISGLLVFLP